MCGITGFLLRNGARVESLSDIIKNMCDEITHRGPDEFGHWCDPERRIALGHRRLSILDLSPSGSQPLSSPNGRFVVTLNGEIYNYRELKQELQEIGHQFKGSSDTEVAAVCFQEYGIEESLRKFVGMFAFATWDRECSELWLARDRFGEKPIYYGTIDGSFCYASELKALKIFPGWNATINRNALGLLMQHCYIPGPKTIFENVYKLPPATFARIGTNQSAADVTPKVYWSVSQIAQAGSRAKKQTVTDAVEQLNDLLKDAVRRQMVSDVPLGGFLSGGIDSSTIVALMQSQSMDKIKTFSIGFEEPEYNEAIYAKDVAQHLGTEHTELYVSPREARDVIPILPGIYDEPFADSSQIPTYLLSKMTKDHVSVALSGDGADELFCGYGRYGVGLKRWQESTRYPAWVKKYGPSILRSRVGPVFNRLSKLASPVLPKNIPIGGYGPRFNRLAKRLETGTQFDIYRQLVSLWQQPGEIVRGFTSADVLQDLETVMDGVPEMSERMMLTDQLTYLPDDILVKVDRASMANSLEVRAPFLDHRVAEFAWQIEPEIRLRNQITKWPLREVLYKYVPKRLVDRPKMGFGIPIDHWLRSELRDWAEALLSESRLVQEGYLNPAPIREKWKAHLNGTANWHYVLWPVLMFQAWLEQNE